MRTLLIAVASAAVAVSASAAFAQPSDYNRSYNQDTRRYDQQRNDQQRYDQNMRYRNDARDYRRHYGWRHRHHHRQQICYWKHHQRMCHWRGW